MTAMRMSDPVHAAHASSAGTRRPERAGESRDEG